MAADAVLDAIVLVVAADGEVTEREMDLALAVARDLPSLAGVGELDRKLGEAFERFVDEGSAARLAAMGAPERDARVEILLAACAAAAIDGPVVEDEIACIRRIGAAIGAHETEVDKVLASV